MTNNNQTKVGSTAPPIVEKVLGRHGLNHMTGTAEIRTVLNEPGIKDGKWVYWNGKPLEKIE